MTQPPPGPWQWPGPPPHQGGYRPPMPPPRPVAPPPHARPLPQAPHYPQQTYQRPYGYAPPPWPQYRPMPRKSNSGPIIAVSVVAVLILAAGLVGALSVISDPGPVNDVGYASPSSTAYGRSSYAPHSTTPHSRTTTTTQHTTTETTTTTTAPTTTTRTTPAGPKPVYALADNPIHSATNGANVVTCGLPAWRSDAKSAAAFFSAALPCMEQAWAPVMARAGLPYSTPGLEFPSGTQWSSPCGGGSAATWSAFYCGQNNTIYMPFDGLQTDRNGNRAGKYLSVFSHEFAHHIQAISGINAAYWDARYEAGDQTAAGLELSRRSELQAQCFGGMWFAGAQHGGGSISDAVIRDMLADGYERGDWQQGVPRDHGSPQNYGAWQEHGFTNNRTAPCNTWAAGAEHVS